RLARVNVKKFAEQQVELIDDQLRGLGYHIGFGFDFKEELSLVAVGIQVQVLLNESEKVPTRLVDMEVVCSFSLRDLESLRNEEGLVMLPRMVLASFVGIALSTARGVLIGRSRYAQVADYPLPIMSPAKIVNDFTKETHL